MGVMIF